MKKKKKKKKRKNDNHEKEFELNKFLGKQIQSGLAGGPIKSKWRLLVRYMSRIE